MKNLKSYSFILLGLLIWTAAYLTVEDPWRRQMHLITMGISITVIIIIGLDYLKKKRKRNS